VQPKKLQLGCGGPELEQSQNLERPQGEKNFGVGGEMASTVFIVDSGLGAVWDDQKKQKRGGGKCPSNSPVNWIDN